MQAKAPHATASDETASDAAGPNAVGPDAATDRADPGTRAGADRRTRARGNERMCIVTRERDPAEGLIRFVRAPDGAVVPDLRGRLPGRGAHVTARATLVERAARRHLFGRALGAEARAPEDLAEITASLMRADLVAMLPLLRKSGDLVVGSGRVEELARSGAALIVLHASEAAPDGVRKIAQARHAARVGLGVDIPADPLFTVDELGLAFGGDRVIHAAIRRSGGGEAFVGRLRRYRSYCGDTSCDGRRQGERTGSEASSEGRTTRE